MNFRYDMVPRASSRHGGLHALVLAMLVCGVVSGNVCAQTATDHRRDRSEGYYQVESANTVGSENVWVWGRGMGFVWDATPDPVTGVGKPSIRGFIEAGGSVGLLDFVGIDLASRVVSYPYEHKLQFGDIYLGVKGTTPNTGDLQFIRAGAMAGYRNSLLKNYESIAGYRDGGTGFSPEGVIIEGGTVELKALFNLDCIAKNTYLPFTIMINSGLYLPVKSTCRDFTQYQMAAGFAYTGLNLDVFVEYVFKGLVNNSMQPKKISRYWTGAFRTMEVAFSENPSFLTPGLRVRYDNGMALTASVPLLMSTNSGSNILYKGNRDSLHIDFPDEMARGITDPFDPWYAKWKIILQLSFPLRYRQPSSEMMRSYLLLKTTPQLRKIDIDDRLKRMGQEKGGGVVKPAGSEPLSEEQDRRKRLEEIRKRRGQVDEPSELDRKPADGGGK